MTIQVKINLDMHPTSLDLVFPDGLKEGGRVRLMLHRASSRFTYLNERERVPVVRRNKCALDTRYLEENIVLDDVFHEHDGHPLCLLKPASDEYERADLEDSATNDVPNETFVYSPLETSRRSPIDETCNDVPDDVHIIDEDSNCAAQELLHEPPESAVSSGLVPIYVCTVCGYQTKNKNCAIEHMREHCFKGPTVRKRKRKPSVPLQEKNESGETVYRCAECSKQFPAEGLLRIHTRVYHGGTIECSLCPAEASSERDLEKHMVAEHGDSAPLKCSVCNSPHFSPEILKSHELWCSTLGKLKKNLKCQLCDFNTIQYDELCQHVKDSHVEKVVYTCDVCGSLSLDDKLHKEHLKTHEEGEVPVAEGEYQCPVCRKSLANKRGLRLHLKRHPISLIHLCETCGEHFQTQQDLLKHTEQRHKPVTRRYQCRFCMKIFKTSFSVKRHMKKQHGYERPSKSVPWDYITLVAAKPKQGEGQEPSNPPKLVEKAHRRPHRCDVCSFETNKLGRFERHQALHTGVYRYPCPECPRKFAAKTELKKHGQIAHPKNLLTCTYCPRLFESREPSAYQAHIQQHGAGKTRPCHECGHHFGDAEELATHLDQLHSPSLPVECRLCHQRFRLVSHRVNHVRRYHPNVLQRPHICDVCGWAYRYQSGLSVHKLERHSNRAGEKTTTYECNYCGKVFGRGNILALHLRLHTGESPYLCRECGTTFRTPTGLKYHTVNVHTKDYSVFCQICSKGFVSKRKLKLHLIRTHKAQDVEQHMGQKQRAPPVFIERATVPVVSVETGDDSMLDVMQIIDPNELKTRSLDATVQVIDFSELDVAQTSTVECYTEV